MPICQLNEDDLEVLIAFYSNQENGEDDRFEFALKLIKEGHIIEITAREAKPK